MLPVLVDVRVFSHHFSVITVWLALIKHCLRVLGPWSHRTRFSLAQMHDSAVSWASNMQRERTEMVQSVWLLCNCLSMLTWSKNKNGKAEVESAHCRILKLFFLCPIGRTIPSAWCTVRWGWAGLPLRLLPMQWRSMAGLWRKPTTLSSRSGILLSRTLLSWDSWPNTRESWTQGKEVYIQVGTSLQ